MEVRDGRYRAFSPARVIHNPGNLSTVVIDIASIYEFYFLIFIQVFSIV